MSEEVENTTSTKQPDGVEVKSGDLLAGKYKTYDDLKKGVEHAHQALGIEDKFYEDWTEDMAPQLAEYYKETQAQLNQENLKNSNNEESSSETDEAPPESLESDQEPSEDKQEVHIDTIETVESNLKQSLEDDGVTADIFEAAIKEFQETGTISEKTWKDSKLTEAQQRIYKSAINEQVLLTEKFDNTVLGIFDGQENFDQAVEWAKSNYNRDDYNDFVTAITQRDFRKAQKESRLLLESFERSKGSKTTQAVETPQRRVVSGDGSKATADVSGLPRSEHEWNMQNDAYKFGVDEVYTNQRLAILAKAQKIHGFN